MCQGDLATNAIIEFLRDESNRKAMDGIKVIFRTHPESNWDLVLRCMVLGQFGTIPLEPGAKMGLMVRFIELSLNLVNWNRVIKELELDPGDQELSHAPE